MKKHNKMSWYKVLWKTLSGWFERLVWWFQGAVLEAELADAESMRRRSAQKAVNRVVHETNIAPDCVSATIVRGGPTIMVKHDDAWEAFIHNTYAQAAQEAIDWLILQGDELSTSNTSKMNREQRRRFQKAKGKL